ncbi:hypothetical protein GJ496_011976 [Pomphorhynchus laevis]|nr:hypothetical protein GJ496_011976 [Pomphorhynchus laevis]
MSYQQKWYKVCTWNYNDRNEKRRSNTNAPPLLLNGGGYKNKHFPMALNNQNWRENRSHNVSSSIFRTNNDFELDNMPSSWRRNRGGPLVFNSPNDFDNWHSLGPKKNLNHNSSASLSFETSHDSNVVNQKIDASNKQKMYSPVNDIISSPLSPTTTNENTHTNDLIQQSHIIHGKNGDSMAYSKRFHFAHQNFKSEFIKILGEYETDLEINKIDKANAVTKQSSHNTNLTHLNEIKTSTISEIEFNAILIDFLDQCYVLRSCNDDCKLVVGPNARLSCNSGEKKRTMDVTFEQTQLLLRKMVEFVECCNDECISDQNMTFEIGCLSLLCILSQVGLAYDNQCNDADHMFEEYLGFVAYTRLHDETLRLAASRKSEQRRFYDVNFLLNRSIYVKSKIINNNWKQLCAKYPQHCFLSLQRDRIRNYIQYRRYVNRFCV